MKGIGGIMSSYYTKQVLRSRNSKPKLTLTNEEKNKIINEFKHNTCLVKKDVVVIKIDRFGYEIFKSQFDDRYWVYAVTFTEPFNPDKPVYKHHWVGNAFIGYSFDNLEELLPYAKKMNQMGPTRTPFFKDYVADYDAIKMRLVIGSEAKIFTYQEYVKFCEWFNKNKVKIMVKQVNQVYEEDLKNSETKQKYSVAQRIMISKMQQPLTRPKGITTIIMENKSKHDDWSNPKSKKYKIGLLFVEPKY